MSSLDAAENDRIFREEILPSYLSLIPPLRSVRIPTGIVMGGQMGAGKSRLIRALRETTRPSAIVVDADLLREYHPDYEDLKHSNPAAAIVSTADDSGAWTEKLVGALAKRRANLVVEGTMRRQGPFQQTSSLLKSMGYNVHAAILAVDERISWQATLHRAEEMAALCQGMRVVDRTMHDEAATGLVNTVDWIANSDLADRLSVYARDGSLLLDMVAIEGRFPRPGTARDTILAERARPWSEQAVVDHDARWARIIDLMTSRHASEDELRSVAEQRAQDAMHLGLPAQEPSGPQSP